MSNATIIAWTNHTFNSWWGCEKVSAGCKNCYADTLAKRYGQENLWGKNSVRREFGDKHWSEPLKWNAEAREKNEPSRVFCGSMMDWAEDHPSANRIRPQLFELIRGTPWLHWQLLTKRAERIEACLPLDWHDGWPNVWLGTSVENMAVAHRVRALEKIPAAVRFISYEPALGSLNDLALSGLDWVIYGGESGPGFRDHKIEWAREMELKCNDSGVAFFFKQSAAPRTEMGIELDGRIVRKYPIPRKLEWPKPKSSTPSSFVSSPG